MNIAVATGLNPLQQRTIELANWDGSRAYEGYATPSHAPAVLIGAIWEGRLIRGSPQSARKMIAPCRLAGYVAKNEAP